MIAQAVNLEAVREVLAESNTGKLIFPQVVQRMLTAGVQSYFVDAVRAEHTVYLADGATLVENMHLALDPVAPQFSKPAIVAAIRAAQRDEIRYPEFMRRSSAAGVVAYWAYLTGARSSASAQRATFMSSSSPARSQQSSPRAASKSARRRILPMRSCPILRIWRAGPSITSARSSRRRVPG